ncbi:hypothetical protein FACS189413_07000 [Bacteroidia bacterium]|nr:hypothetical protein FACS189413_07000 [Bacteroidia bacterium]
MSFFHILEAMFDNTVDLYQRISIFVVFIYLIYIFERKAYSLLLFLPFTYLFVQSPTPDLPVYIFSLMILYEMVFVEKEKQASYAILLFLSVFTFVTKPVAFWLPLWVIMVYGYKNRKLIFSPKAYILPALLVVLYVFKNVYTSSLLLFPATSTVVPTIYAPAASILEESRKTALLFTYHHYFTIAEINAFSIGERLYHWFVSCRFASIVHILIFLVVGVYSLFAVKKRQFVLLSLLFVVLLKLIYVFLFSGQYRFMLDGVLALLFVLCNFIFQHRQRIVVWLTLLSCMLAALLMTFPRIIAKAAPDFRPVYWMSPFRMQTFLKPQNYDFDEYEKVKLGNMDLYITPYKDTFSSQIPVFTAQQLICYYHWNIFPQMRNPSDIRQGFIYKELLPEEKEQLKQWIEDILK